MHPTEAVASSDNDEALEAFIREGSACIFHACVTCKVIAMQGLRNCRLVKERRKADFSSSIRFS
jgi:hypothetical protein